MKLVSKTIKCKSEQIIPLTTVDIKKEIKALKKKIPKDSKQPYQNFLAKKKLIISFYDTYSNMLSEKQLVERYNQLKLQSTTSPANNSILSIALVVGLVTSAFYTIGIGTYSELGLIPKCWEAVIEIIRFRPAETVSVILCFLCKCLMILGVFMVPAILILGLLFLLKVVIPVLYRPNDMLNDMLIEEELKIIKKHLNRNYGM